ncbi:MAG TPA: PspC domain-containing protein [Actinomycetota bacterium]|nr:PspC domain-containing protein [Actinomycetota bacterium]
MLTRSRTDRVLAGVAGGIGERLGIDPVLIRLAFIVLALAGGAGVVAYLVCALLSVPPDPDRPPPPVRTGARQVLEVGLVVAGTLLVLREAGLWLGDRLVWPAALAVLGSAVLWTRGDEAERGRRGRLLGPLPGPAGDALAGRGAGVRTAAGALLVLAGLIAFLRSNDPLALLGNAPLALGATAIGLAAIAGPGLSRLVRQLAEERRERIRQEERAEVAAHLHDSVLQTLALIQRADDPRLMRTLARVQERSLRDWLYGRRGSAGPERELSGAVDRAAAEVERAHGVRVELVMVGDARLEGGLPALVEALREALVNAAKHSGTSGVSVYVEVEADAVTAYVRDQGSGFDPRAVPPDRRGIAESIRGRMRRNGGTGVVVSRPGGGTEVRLRMPREAR